MKYRSTARAVVCFAGLSCASLFDAGTALSSLGKAAVAISALPALGVSTYTKISLYAALWIFVNELRTGILSPAMPALFVNQVAICFSFQHVVSSEPQAAAAIAAENGWSRAGFHARNVLAHWVPAALLLFRVQNPEYRRVVTVSPAFFTAGVHMAWAYLNHGSLDLSGAYVRLPRAAWESAWNVALTAHFLAGAYWVILA